MPESPDGVVWLARKDSNLRSPDPELDDVDRVCQPFFELSSASRAVFLGIQTSETPAK
jgi:hypothetical protein